MWIAASELLLVAESVQLVPERLRQRLREQAADHCLLHDQLLPGCQLHAGPAVLPRTGERDPDLSRTNHNGADLYHAVHPVSRPASSVATHADAKLRRRRPG